VVWLAINDDGQPTCFAGIWTMNGLLRGHLDHEVEAGPQPAQRLRLSYHAAEGRCRTAPPESNAFDPDD
jgi:hypothetical protein